MNKRRTYEAFTLVEMLVVMGILIILMVLGIAAGRFALNRAADVAHRNGADQLFEGLQAYYVDNRAYPKVNGCGTEALPEPCSPSTMMGDPEVLGKYLDAGAFNGGSGATYIYLVGGNNNDQAALICVSMMGTKDINDETDEGSYYCTGNGFDADAMSAGTYTFTAQIDTNVIENGDPLWEQFVLLPEGGDGTASDWNDNAWDI